MKKAYRTIRKQGKVNEQELTRFLAKNGQGLLPMVSLIEQCQVACNELIGVTGQAACRPCWACQPWRASETRRSRANDAQGRWPSMAVSRAAIEASEAEVEALLEDIVSRGVDPKRKMLFNID